MTWPALLGVLVCLASLSRANSQDGATHGPTSSQGTTPPAPLPWHCYLLQHIKTSDARTIALDRGLSRRNLRWCRGVACYSDRNEVRLNDPRHDLALTFVYQHSPKPAARPNIALTIAENLMFYGMILKFFGFALMVWASVMAHFFVGRH
ncbi:hypothetical protein Vretimale_2146 [Volvox reticuliferus]|uniref:Uncharacterized protein n=1 Tax=Volvox reticuliferus TaxID=1737510 RepID=A0A8J4G2T1_9CHLO|nr:hypothetical protein Vretifemale_4561 [Volvox reticuliferus]GIL96475.1 hypothetical protein Vretimale_2146 [Volvox reticuliferus]